MIGLDDRPATEARPAAHASAEVPSPPGHPPAGELGSRAEPPRERAAERRRFQQWLRQRLRDRLVQENLGLVYREVARYRAHCRDLADLVQEGCLGLIHAAERFDPARGVRFSTYAVPWIRQAVDRAARAHQRMVRLPRRWRETLEGDGQLRPELLPAASLDCPPHEAAEEPLAASLPDPTADPEHDAITAVLVESLAAALSRCPEREREVIRRRYGLDGHPPQTLEAIASELGICRERVRQLEAAALRRLRLCEGFLDPMR
ncbi:MAG: hypothetical protein KatS3mg061_0344 [Dehalococcoidia bacterium]|nr:MAG: hypothetical protein KatS3mg061_0344 [Dehalococcoidia bacterium]